MFTFEQLQDSFPAEWVGKREDWRTYPIHSSKPAVWIHKDADLPAKAATFLNGAKVVVFAGAYVAPKVNFGSGVIVGPGSRVEDSCHVGEETYIGQNVLLKKGADIGNNCHLEDGVIIGEKAMVGSFSKLAPKVYIPDEGKIVGPTQIKSSKGEHRRVLRLNITLEMAKPDGAHAELQAEAVAR